MHLLKETWSLSTRTLCVRRSPGRREAAHFSWGVREAGRDDAGNGGRNHGNPTWRHAQSRSHWTRRSLKLDRVTVRQGPVPESLAFSKGNSQPSKREPAIWSADLLLLPSCPTGALDGCTWLSPGSKEPTAAAHAVGTDAHPHRQRTVSVVESGPGGQASIPQRTL